MALSQIPNPGDPAFHTEPQAVLHDRTPEIQETRPKGYDAKAIFWSVVLPPIGIYYFVKYFFITPRALDKRKLAWICLIGTIISSLANAWVVTLLFQYMAKSTIPDVNLLYELMPLEKQNLLHDLTQ